MKRLIKLICFSIILLISIPFSVQAGNTLVKTGDYISFGKYNGENIIWRVVEETDYGLVLLSENVLEIKELDSDSARWGTSSVRQWLNSENGFLSEQNFSEDEQSVLFSHTYKTLLNDSLISASSSGNSVHLYNRFAENVLKNYDNAYAETLSDKVFLPSVKDIEKINSDIYVFGINKVISKPSTKMWEKYKTNYKDIKKSGGWYYWLRDSMFGNGERNRCVFPDGTVGYSPSSSSHIGIRPMCCIDKATFGIVSGKGDEDDPYHIGNTDYIAIYSNGDYGMAGNTVEITVSTNYSGPYTVEIYNGSNIIASGVNDKLDISLQKAENVFIAKLIDGNGNTVATSQPLTIYGLAYNEIKKVYSNDFNESLNSSVLEWVDIDEERGKAALLKAPAKKNNTLSIGRYPAKKPCAYIDVDLRFDTMFTCEKIPMHFSMEPSGELMKPISIDRNGYLSLNHIAVGSGNKIKLNEGQWYNFKVLIDQDEHTMTVAVDNVVLCKDAPLSVEFDYIDYVTITNINYSSATENYIYIDNLYVASVDKYKDEISLYLYDMGNNRTQVILVNNLGEPIEGELILCSYDKKSNQVLDVLITPVNIEKEKIYSQTFTMGYSKSEDNYLNGFILRGFDTLEPLAPKALER